MKQKTITKSLLLLGTALTGLFVSLNRSSSVSAYSLTVSTSGSVTANVMPSANGGIGTTVVTDNVNIISDCRAGYTMTIAGPTDNNLYLNGDSTNNTSGTYFSPVNGTSALNTSANANKWGYSLTANSGTGVFSALSSTPTTLKTPSQTASPDSDIDTTIPVYYGTAVNTSMAPGSYTFSNNTSIAYTVVMDATCLTVNIAYDGNNADEGTMGAVGTGVIHTGVKDGDTVSLIASNFSRTGYGFAGWSTDPNAGTKLLDNDNTNNPIVYGPQEDVTLPAGFTDLDTDNDGIVKLYAVWLQSQGNLQGWMGCNNLDTAIYDSTTGALDLTKNSVTALTDQRDNDTYAVARLADGECWMIENLRLDHTAELTIYNTNNPLNDGTNVTLKHNYTDTVTYNTLSAPGSWCYNYSSNGNCASQSRLRTDNTANRATNPTTDTNTNIYSYGNYYNWYSATAGQTPYGASQYENNAKGDLCPMGWRLPRGGQKNKIESNENDFWNLIVEGINSGVKPVNYSSSSGPYYHDPSERTAIAAKITSFPNNFIRSGTMYSSNNINYRNVHGRYWASTLGSYRVDQVYSFTFDPQGDTFPGVLNDDMESGKVIRCMALTPVNYTLSYNANGGSGAPNSQSIMANGSATFAVSNTTPTRSGYTFAGWMDEKGNEAQSGSSFTTKNPNTTLYAIWTNNTCNPTATTIGTGNASTDAVCLQDVKPGMKTSLLIADATAGTYNLIDARDGQSYTVAKLADGELWLTKNLNYGNNTDILLTSYDTDLPTGSTFKAPASTTDFETTNSNATYISPKILTDNTYGGYYSYAAAIASTEAYSTSNQNITTSICPKGWDLPTSASYNNLRTVSGNTTYATMSAVPYSFIYAGYRNGTSFSNQTSTLRLWTSTNYSSSYGYYTTAYGTASTNYKRYGESVRCITSNGTATINYDGNGTTEYPVTGTTASQANIDINSTNAMANGFTRTDWVFNGWNTAADGSGTTIATGASLSVLNLQPNSSITLYAQWLPQYTITYVNNCTTYVGINGNCTQDISGTTSEQKINLDASGNGSGTLASSTQWTLTDWKIRGWSVVIDNSTNTNIEYPTSSTYSVTNQWSGDGITLYAQWTPTYSIQYDGNGASNPEGMGTADVSTGVKSVRQVNVGEGDLITLLASNFKRPGYGFVGWSTDPNAWAHFTDNDNTNNPTIYGPMETITAPAYPNNGIITMYAIWIPAKKDNNNNPIYLQNWIGCSSLTSTVFNTTTGEITVDKNSVIALTDQRDNEVYTVAKLADGRCWMVENLKLEASGTIGNNINNNNVTNQSLSQGYGGTTGTYGSFVGLSGSETANFTNTTTSNDIYKATGNPPTDTYNPINNTLEDIGSTNYPEYRFPRYNNSNNANALSNPTFTEDYINTKNISTSGNYKTSTVSSYGNYYTWAAAVANTNYDPSEATNTSLCPAGWHLPSGSNNVKEYGNLANKYGDSATSQIRDIVSNRIRSFPNNFVLSGIYNSSSANNRGTSGSYWSRSSSGYNYSYYLSLSLTSISSYNFRGTKSSGFSIRCLADYLYTIQYDGNNATSGNMISDGDELKHTNVTEGDTINLYPSNYYKDGYGFIGWSTDPDAWTHFTDNDSTNDPTIYGPMEIITAPARTGNIMTFYAVWVPAAKDNNNNPIYLQDFNTASCNNLTSAYYDSSADKIIADKNSIIALTDRRDNNVYAIARLTDNNCWMMENLRLDAANTTGNNQYTPTITNESLSNGYGGAFVGLDATENSNFDKDNTNPTPNNLYNNSNITGEYSSSRFPRYNNNNTNTTLNASYDGEGDTIYYSWYSYGNYYTWAAAIASTDHYLSETEATTSICPTNWDLPLGGRQYTTPGSFSYLYQQMHINDYFFQSTKVWRAFPHNYIYSGYISGSTVRERGGRGAEGAYWSKTADTSTSTYILTVSDTAVMISNVITDKAVGLSIRCVILGS